MERAWRQFGGEVEEVHAGLILLPRADEDQGDDPDLDGEDGIDPGDQEGE